MRLKSELYEKEQNEMRDKILKKRNINSRQMTNGENHQCMFLQRFFR